MGRLRVVAFILAVAPLQIHVADTVHTADETDWPLFLMTVLGTAASAAVTIVTAVLAARTVALARETKRMADKTADLAAATLDSVKTCAVRRHRR